jgi:hypothetical protein
MAGGRILTVGAEYVTNKQGEETRIIYMVMD